MTYKTGLPPALKGVNFTIDDGEFVFIIGSSGSGKSTIVKLLTCEEKVSNGTVMVGEYNLNRIKRRWVPYLRRNIGMVFQDFRLIQTKTIFENIAFALEILGFSKKAIRRQVSMVLSTVGLRHREHAFPHELSGGEQQRVAIARAMVNNPAILLADEPTGNLDPVNSETVMALLEEINRSGTTVVVCTHDRELVNRMKKRVIVIDDGNLVRDEGESIYNDEAFRADNEETIEESAYIKEHAADEYEPAADVGKLVLPEDVQPEPLFEAAPVEGSTDSTVAAEAKQWSTAALADGADGPAAVDVAPTEEEVTSPAEAQAEQSFDENEPGQPSGRRPSAEDYFK